MSPLYTADAQNPLPCLDLRSYLADGGRGLVVPASDFLVSGELGLEVQSGRVSFKKPFEGPKPCAGKKRGRVKLMSDSSRRRLMAKFASLDYAALAEMKTPLWFVTLTTPPPFWTDPRGVYLALRRFRDALEYEQSGKGYLGAMVRREIGAKSGMLHYHMVVFGGALVGAQVKALWTKSLRSDVPVRVDVQPLESPERVAKYLSKYCSKIGYSGKESAPETPSGESRVNPEGAPDAPPLSEAHNVGNDPNTYTGGRWWYIWGSKNLPWAEMLLFYGDDAHAISKHLKRIFRKWMVQKVVSREIARWNDGLPHGVAKATTFFVFGRRSKRALEKEWAPYGDFLRRSDTGFTFLVPPELLQRMIKAACLAVLGSPAKFPWEIGA